MRKYRNPIIKPYASKANKNYYSYSFVLFHPDKKRFHFYLAKQSISSNDYSYVSFNTLREIFSYSSYLHIFENLYLTFYAHGNYVSIGATHNYFILSPSAEVKIERYSYYA